MTRRGILAGGNWIIDQLKAIDAWPAQDALANIVSETTGNGGSPFNLLVDLDRLGAGFPIAGVGLVGNDDSGRLIRQTCAQHRIDSSALATHPTLPTSYTDVMTVTSTGRRTFFHCRGANSALGPEHFDFSETQARIFHLGYLLLLDLLDGPDAQHGTVAAGLLARAKAAGLLTSIDVVSEQSQRFAQVVKPALRHVDFCILNEIEAGGVTGITIRTGEKLDLVALRGAAEAILAEGVQRVVMIHFPEGACALGHDGIWHLQGSVRVPESEIISAVGAGDAFAAGALLALHEERPVDEALRSGVVAAAACLLDWSTSRGVRPLADCQELAARWGVRELSGDALT